MLFVQNGLNFFPTSIVMFDKDTLRFAFACISACKLRQSKKCLKKRKGEQFASCFFAGGFHLPFRLERMCTERLFTNFISQKIFRTSCFIPFISVHKKGWLFIVGRKQACHGGQKEKELHFLLDRDMRGLMLRPEIRSLKIEFSELGMEMSI